MIDRNAIDKILEDLDEHEHAIRDGVLSMSTYAGQGAVLRALMALVEGLIPADVGCPAPSTALPASTPLRRRAMALYRPPFSAEYGYIFDANDEVVADDQDPEKDQRYQQVISHVRGWGRISHLETPAALQDEVSAIVAEALTEYWERHKETP